MSSVVFDASALLALLHRERGADLVERHLPGAALSAVNYSETLKKAVEKGARLADAELAIRGLQLEIVPFDERLASAAAGLWENSRKLGLSLADRSCLALACDLNRPAVTADKRWAEVDINIEVKLIR